jgi:hypothetical protein
MKPKVQEINDFIWKPALSLEVLDVCKKIKREKSSQLTWRVSPEGSDMQRGSFINSHANMVGSFLYSIPVMVFFLVNKVWKKDLF